MVFPRFEIFILRVGLIDVEEKIIVALSFANHDGQSAAQRLAYQCLYDDRDTLVNEAGQGCDAGTIEVAEANVREK